MQEITSLEDRARDLVELIDLCITMAFMRTKGMQGIRQENDLNALRRRATQIVIRILLPFEPTHGPGVED